VRLLREAGATEVHMRSSAPPFTNPCYYGTDIDSKENLIACKYPLEQIAEVIGADSMGYLDINHLNMLIGNKPGEGVCDGGFSGNYATAIPTEGEKDRFEKKISEKE
ncbi:MAG: amidophosphoribosyltransferase, partial [Clostridiales bacterium]|nr:amidophosphoribosyltransferase [Clostridiales bacterium]